MTTPPFKVKAIYEYQSPHDDDLHFPNGQIITVTEDDEDDWYTGQYVDASGVQQEGIFPRNFVEKFEPTAPPRPSRAARPKKEEIAIPAEEPLEHAKAPTNEDTVSSTHPVSAPTTIVKETSNVNLEQASATSRSIPVSIPTNDDEPVSQSQRKPPVATKAAPPPVSEKPSSFRDRIAAFNKPAAGTPPAPFKPTGLSSGGAGAGSFVKKPFVAPPPSREAYIPVVRNDAPQKIYRREEDPEIAKQEAESQEQAEKAGLVPSNNADNDDDQPKPTSLKERIALLQKQQMETANRQAEAAQKKEKPKKPVKKKEESEAAHTTDMSMQHEPLQDKTRPSIDTIRSAEQVPQIPVQVTKAPRLPALDHAVDGNEADMSGAGEETEGFEDLSASNDGNDKPTFIHHQIPTAYTSMPPTHEADVGEEEGLTDEEPPVPEDTASAAEEDVEEDEDEEEEIDPEVRRKEELRQRMAKMSGGMGMHGMFGPPGGMGMGMPMGLPAKKKAPVKQVEEEASQDSLVSRAPPVPMPGMLTRDPHDARQQTKVEREVDVSSPSIIAQSGPLEVKDIEDIQPTSQIPTSRPAPPPVPTDSRPHVPPTPGVDPELHNQRSPIDTPKLSLQTNPAPPINRDLPPRPAAPTPMSARPVETVSSPTSPPVLTKRASYFSSDGGSGPTSPTTPGSKRMSRMPPIPGAVNNVDGPPVQVRAPPPPPPSQAPPPMSRSSTGDDIVLESIASASAETSEEEADPYEGDYDTDIASAVPHKEALKARTREDSQDTIHTFLSSPASPALGPPPPPVSSAPRAVPPPPPTALPPMPVRQSMDIPRAAPPPVPAAAEVVPDNNLGSLNFDPYNYSTDSPTTPARIPPVMPSRQLDNPPSNAYEPRGSLQQDRTMSSPRDQAPPSAGRVRQSTDLQRAPTTSRRSSDMTRLSQDTGFVAMDIDLAAGTKWWTSPQGLPPVFQGRKDILFETEESTTTKRGGIAITTKDVYILFADYSQTVITISYDPQNPADAQLTQRQSPPPNRLRQDQLEAAWDQFGRSIGNTAASQKDTVVGDGTPSGLVNALLKAYPNALLPVGTRAYGALVYSNLANASVSQYDEIRPGDIITLRNAKLQGKHGPMHAKYSTEVGSGSGHVAIVQEWDGTKKKVRAWEQGRENRKVKSESYKLDDLRSGEVKIWRVMPRDWVGWTGSN